MLDKITITNVDGTTSDAEFITAFEMPDFGRKYVIYTFNEPDPNGLAMLSISQLIEEGGEYQIKKIETDEEWTKIKEVLKEIIKGGNA